MNEINIHNDWHLGDSIFNIHYLNQYNNEPYVFNYYVKQMYIDELTKHIKNPNINLISLNNGLPKNSHNMWIGFNNFFWEWTSKSNMYDLFYVDYFKNFSNTSMLLPGAWMEICLNSWKRLSVNFSRAKGLFLLIMQAKECSPTLRCKN